MKENSTENLVIEDENPNIFSRVGGFTIGLLNNIMMIPPVQVEPVEGSKKAIGAGVLAAAAGLAGTAAMIGLDKTTGMGTNPLNYIIPLHLLSSR